MNLEHIKKELSKFNHDVVNNYLIYLNDLYQEIDKKKNQPRNKWWMDRHNDAYFANAFSTVEKDGLVFDGVHITLQSTGISFDYIAYKNKMLILYPETLFDVQLVRQGDKFSFSKVSGKVNYQHEIVNPFGDAEIIGAYAIIKNGRGEFLTLLSRAEIDKHRKTARQDYIWSNWLNEMSLKTVIKKACKQHFADVYQNIETLDNEQTDLEQPLGISIETKQAIEAIDCMNELKKYYNDNKDANAGFLEDFGKACTIRKEALRKEVETAKIEAETNADS